MLKKVSNHKPSKSFFHNASPLFLACVNLQNTCKKTCKSGFCIFSKTSHILKEELLEFMLKLKPNIKIDCCLMYTDCHFTMIRPFSSFCLLKVSLTEA